MTYDRQSDYYECKVTVLLKCSFVGWLINRKGVVAKWLLDLAAVGKAKSANVET